MADDVRLLSDEAFANARRFNASARRLSMRLFTCKQHKPERTLRDNKSLAKTLKPGASSKGNARSV